MSRKKTQNPASIIKELQQKKLHPLSFRSEKQRTYYNLIKNKEIVFGLGASGSGKTLIPVYYALEQLTQGSIDKIYFTKPTVEVGDTLGFMPGKMGDKFAPYVQSLLDHCNDFIGHQETLRRLSAKDIECKPMQFMRGVTFKDCVIVADEIQNAHYVQIKTLLSRIGDNCKIVFTADTKQCDIKNSDDFEKTLKIVKDLEEVGICKFTSDDIVRSGLVKKLMQAYEKYEDSV